MKELVFAFMLVWPSVTPVHHSSDMGEDFVCFQAAPMLKDFLTQTTGWKNIFHKRGYAAVEFFAWYNSVPPRTRIVADEVIIFGKSGKKFYWIWVLHQGCWINLFKTSVGVVDAWIMKLEREEAKSD